jgi:NADH-quinone oxidoreductase subunit N
MKWILFGPELYYFATAGVFLTLSMVARPNPRRDYWVALTMAMAGVVVSLAAVRSQGTLFFQTYRIDLFSQVFKLLLAMALFLVVSICSELKGIRAHRHREFYVLLSVCTLAMMMLVSSVELVTLYVSLELASYSLYILVALRRGYGPHMEASIKYFLLGAATSAAMLFGLASLYSATHTTYVAELVRLVPQVIGSPMAFIGLLLTLCGFFFKLALFPFHVWAPSVYQGAANQVTAYIATATKVAAIAILMRIVSLSAGNSADLIHILAALAIASMTLGNLVAIVQKDLKRLLAYSAIAHAGYVLIGILTVSENGYAGAIFYALAYLAMNFTCFLVVAKVAQDGSDLKVVQLAGLHRRSPLLAMALMVGVFSLGGIPPTIGFTGKFLVFVAAMQKGYFYLVFIGMINVAVSLYYYALVVKAAYLQEPAEALAPIRLSIPTRLLAVMMVIVIVVGGMFPAHLYSLARAAAHALV